MRAPNGAPEAFLRAHVSYSGDNCVLWPFCALKKGYGSVTIEGAHKAASRWMCILAHGEPPSPKHEAAHSCGNPPCINPNHIRWATSAENKADRDLHGSVPRGERNGSSRLCAGDILAIRADPRPLRLIAADYGISLQNASYIRRRESWSHIP